MHILFVQLHYKFIEARHSTLYRHLEVVGKLSVIIGCY